MSAPKPTRIAILASGGGSNARKIIEYFAESNAAEVVLLASNNAQSGIFTFGPQADLPCVHLTKEQHRDADFLLGLFKAFTTDLTHQSDPSFLVKCSRCQHSLELQIGASNGFEFYA